jgi:hypothetical protein
MVKPQTAGSNHTKQNFHGLPTPAASISSRAASPDHAATPMSPRWSTRVSGPRAHHATVFPETHETLKSETPGDVGPRFRTAPVGWRGYTLDVAKWTLSSEQLRAIVSRAIRQSAETSSLRLLPLDVLDTVVPAELEALETRADNARAQYRVLAGRRNHLLHTLAGDGEPADPADVRRAAAELADLNGTLDTLAEEMYFTADQARQLHSIRDTHSYSALAMALRKLNGSFLKQAGDVQELKRGVAALELERDDAWRQAQELAQELDDANARLARSANEALRHASGMTGLDAASRAPNSKLNSDRISSTDSNGMSSATRSTFEELPPMPPLPLQRPRPLVVRTSNVVECASYGTCSAHARLSDADVRLQHSLRGVRPRAPTWTRWQWSRPKSSCTPCLVSRKS